MTLQIETVDREPSIITIFGEAGLGKTSLAASFPNPLFLQAEKGLRSVPGAKALPKPKSVEELFEQLTSVIKNEHDYQTLVVDSVTALETMFTEYVVASDPSNPRSINQACGGYGAGREAVAGLHRRVRRAAEVLRTQRGMHVVFIAHADVERLDNPDQDSFTRYTLRLHAKSQSVYVDDVDLVGFIRLKTVLLGEDGNKKARSSGERSLVCHAVASNVSKNRLGIDKEIPIVKGINPLIDWL